MPRSASLARRSTLWRWLRASLVLGALYDLVLSAALIVAPGQVCAWLAVPPPTETFYLALLGVFLATFAAFSLLAASDMRRYFDLVAIFVAGRVAASAAFSWFAWREARLSDLFLLAAGEALLAILHAGPWWILRQ